MSYNFFNDFVLRTPERPLKDLNLFLQKDRNDQYDFIKRFFSDPINNKALLIASEELFKSFEKFSQCQITDAKKEKHVFKSLVKYFLRMTTRPTPFGLFSGLNVGSLGDETCLILDPKKDQVSKDYRYIFGKEILRELIKNQSISKKLKYSLSNTLYRVGSNWRYTEYTENSSGTRDFKITELDGSALLNSLFVEFKYKSFYKNEIVQSIKNQFPDEILEDIEHFVDELFLNQVINLDSSNGIYDQDVFSYCINLLKHIDNEQLILIDYNKQQYSVSEFIKKLSDWKSIVGKELVSSFCESKNNERSESREKIVINQINGVERCVINKELLKDVSGLIDLLSPWYKNENAFLSTFKKQFKEKFEDLEVPFLTVFDPDLGINIGKQNDSKNHLKKSDTSNIWLSSIQQYLLKKIIEIKNTNANTLELDPDELRFPQKNTTVNLGQTVTGLGKIVNINGTQTLYIKGLGDSSATCVLTRFAGNDTQIDKLIETIVDKESVFSDEGNYISAELVHLPEDNFGDLLKRPLIRNFFLPYITTSSLEVDRKIDLQDLVVSVANDIILIRSLKHNKYINIKLSTAHNFTYKSLPIYQFLAEIQTQNALKGLGLDWTWCNGIINHIPRIKFGGLLLSLQTWIFSFDDLKHLTVQDNANMSIIESWRTKHQIPRYITIDEEDNELFIDLEDNTCIDLFLSVVKKAKRIIKLTEFIFSNENSCVRDNDENGYAHEIFFTLYNTENVFNIPAIGSLDDDNKSDKFEIGSEWVYLKFYCEEKSAEKLLTDIIYPLKYNLIKQNIISKWFFIRYIDPEPHLRIRFKIKKLEYISNFYQVINDLIRKSKKNVLIKKIQIERYQRELSRYGIDTIEFVETIFRLQSDFILDLLNFGEIDNLTRRRLSLIYIDEFLKLFGYHTDTKEAFCKQLADAFLNEFGNSTDIRKMLMGEYKSEKDFFKNFGDLNCLNSFDNVISKTLKNCLRSSELSAGKIVRHYKNETSNFKLGNIIASIIHMFMNRLYLLKPREEELNTYNLLWLHYRSLKFKK